MPLPASWYEPCRDSVRGWAASRGYEYQWLGDELFDLLPTEIRARTRAQPVVASDIARLAAMQNALADGADRAVWLDADTFVISADRFELPAGREVFGREVWVQEDAAGRLRVHDKIHNAFLQFASDSPVLPFYRYAAERLVLRHEGAMVPQLAGPKFLAVLHNLLELPVAECAQVLSPVVIRDLIAGDGPALELFRRSAPASPAAVNLCGSLVASGQLEDTEVAAAIGVLGRRPELLERGR
jgi:hypothetical protein